MSSRRTLLTLAAAAAALTLAACGPENDPSPAPTNAAPTVPTTATSVPTAKPTGGATGGATGAPVNDPNCTAPAVPAGHKMLNLSKAATVTTVYAKETKYLCGKPEGGWIDAGEEKTYTFAPGATAKLADLNYGTHAATLLQFAAHTDSCINHTSAADQDPCFPRNTYDVVLDGSGKITSITQVGLTKPAS
ncbi:hypothetical protein F7Q99_12685 [Streptomyces kaniharaensis]|uniref:LppP/LprE family lipoprotein n=1 Tax=Streptomyces kaniharaensis TaxID=212423 RepID=A0A6N7KNM2_9ACTN|nr:hypothetical protein [Streptomyces kaniharaensis]MQS13116.1 hypothetical protein [Streptomyces kaniharaensis]